MAYRYYNPNPFRKSTSDCIIRALTAVTGKDWDTVYAEVCATGYRLKEMPVSNNVWRLYLTENGFQRYFIPNTWPFGYTVREFCQDNKVGTFLLFVGEHVIAVKNGDYYDTFDSGYESPSFFWRWEGDEW